MWLTLRIRHAVVFGILFGGLAGGVVCAGADDRIANATQLLPAVDGVNAKASGFAGVVDGRALFGGDASLTIPLGFRYGLQLDGLVASFDERFQGDLAAGGVGAHLFWRDPEIGLVGAYGHYVHAEAASSFDLYAGAAEGALYLGRFTLEGVAGIAGRSDGPGAAGDADTGFYGVARLAWYPTDDLKLSTGYGHAWGRHALLLGAELGLGGYRGAAASVYASGVVTDDGDATLLAGLRVYWGRPHKTLIHRHREGDPSAFNPFQLSSIGTLGGIDDNTGGAEIPDIIP